MRPAVSAASPAQVVRRSKRANSFAIERCYSFALIVIDRAAFSYQSSDFKTFGRLTDLRSSPFVFLDRELGDLRSNFGGASTFTTAKYLLPPRTKYPLTNGALLVAPWGYQNSWQLKRQSRRRDR